VIHAKRLGVWFADKGAGVISALVLVGIAVYDAIRNYKETWATLVELVVGKPNRFKRAWKYIQRYRSGRRASGSMFWSTHVRESVYGVAA